MRCFDAVEEVSGSDHLKENFDKKRRLDAGGVLIIPGQGKFGEMVENCESGGCGSDIAILAIYLGVTRHAYYIIINIKMGFLYVTY